MYVYAPAAWGRVGHVYIERGDVYAPAVWVRVGARPMSFEPLAVLASGALTPAGDDVEETCASIRAGLLPQRYHPRFAVPSRDPDVPGDEPLVYAPVDRVDPSAAGPERLLALLVPALEDLARRAPSRPDGAALLLSLPVVDDVTATWDLGAAFTEELRRRAPFEIGPMRTARTGHPGALELLDQASVLLRARQARVCVVAGADTFVDDARLLHLEATGRLRSPRHLDGFFPAEGAAAVLVGDGAAHAGVPAPPAELRVLGVGFGEEPATSAGERPSSGAGLTHALREAIGERAAEWVICDLNGDAYRGMEWGMVLARLGERFSGLRRLVCTARGTGDIGAATGALLLGAAAAAWRRGYAAGPEAVLWAAGDGGARAAARVARG